MAAYISIVRAHVCVYVCMCAQDGLAHPPHPFFFFLIIVVYKKNLETAGLNNRVRSALYSPLHLKENPSCLTSFLY